MVAVPGGAWVAWSQDSVGSASGAGNVAPFVRRSSQSGIHSPLQEWKCAHLLKGPPSTHCAFLCCCAIAVCTHIYVCVCICIYMCVYARNMSCLRGKSELVRRGFVCRCDVSLGSALLGSVQSTGEHAKALPANGSQPQSCWCCRRLANL